MVKQVVGIIGWIGVAIVFGAVGISRGFYLQSWLPYLNYILSAGLVCILVAG